MQKNKDGQSVHMQLSLAKRKKQKQLRQDSVLPILFSVQR
jgi:hypothetical protein